jgi:uncharacterized protein
MNNKKTEWLKFQTEKGEEITFPLATVKGVKDGPTLIITAGIHGAEYAGIAAAIRFFKELNPEKLTGTVKIVTISNLKAFEKRSMFVCPVDDKNLNRMFPGDKMKGYSDALAYYLFNEVILKGDYYIDLHGGDIVELLIPFSIYHKSGKEEIDKKSLALAQYYGLPNIQSTTLNEGMTYTSASEKNIPSIIAEAGEIGQLDEVFVSMHLNGLYNVCKYLGYIDGEPKKPENINYCKNFVRLHTSQKGIFYTKVKIGEQVKKDQIIGIIEDYFGDEVEKIASPITGRVMFLTTSPAVKDNGLLMEVWQNN